MLTNLEFIKAFNAAKAEFYSPQKYDEANDEHEKKLLKFRAILKPGEEDARFTKNWIDIGFQGANPATDFRGSGILGLD
jgi:hypothetical protein